MATKFQLAVEAVFKGHGLLEKFQTQTEFHLRLEQAPYERGRRSGKGGRDRTGNQKQQTTQSIFNGG